MTTFCETVTPGSIRVVAPAAMMRWSKVTWRVEPSLRATSIEVAPVSVPQPSISSTLFFFMRKWTPLTMLADTWRERAWVGPKDIVASPSMPYLALSCWSRCASSAFLMSALLGMQPTLRQTPPQYFFSTTATLFPSCDARIAATYPPGPAPSTTTSKSAMRPTLSGGKTPSHRRPRRVSCTALATGAAVLAPGPPCATTTETTHVGRFAGA